MTNIIDSPPIDPQRIRQVGREMTVLIHRYVRPLTFGDGPPLAPDSLTVGGTVTFLKTDRRCFGVTNRHVVESFREMTRARAKTHCQLDEMLFDPDARLIDEDIDLDIATLDVSESEIASIGATAFSPTQWPQGEPEVGEFAIAVGYPGRLKFLDSPMQMAFTYIGVVVPITSVNESMIELQFDRKYWVAEKGSIDWSTFKDFGGFSGAGLFVMRLAAELVGIVRLHWLDIDLMHCSRSDFICANGTIRHGAPG